MGKQKRPASDSVLLRKKAEKLLKKKILKTVPELSEAETIKLIHEVEVHQIELDLQNEELTRAMSAVQDELALYDFAPIAYFNLSKEGEIIKLNFVGAQLLGKTRSELMDRKFSIFVSDETRPVFNDFLENIIINKGKGSCEVTLSVNDNLPVYVHLSAFVAENSETCILAVNDITERKQLDETQAFLLQTGYPGRGEDFFQSLARYLAHSLGMDYVCIDRLEGDGLTAQTVAIFNDGKFDANQAYTLKDTPCGDVVGKTICCFTEDVCRLFPHDPALRELHAESYVGTTLWGFDGKPIGLIAVIGRKPLRNPGLAKAVLKLAALRAAGELERTQHEAELQQSKQRLEMAQVSSGAGIWDWDMVAHRLHWSDELFHLFGLDPAKDEASFDSWGSMIHPDDREIAQYRIDQAIKTKTPLSSEYRVIFDGQVRWIVALGNTTYDASGDPVRMTGICIDITTRKQAEEALRVSEDRLRTITENAPDMILELDRLGNILYMNRVLSGYRMEEVIGRNFCSWTLPEYTPLIMNALEMIFATALPQSIQVHGFGANGELRLFLARLSPVFESGQVKSAIAIATDITESRLVEKALKESEDRFAKAFQSNPAALSITRLVDGLFIEVNDRFIQLFGYERNELIGKKSAEINLFTNPDDRKNIIRVLQEIGKFSNYEIIGQNKNGDLLIVLVSAERISYKGDEHILFAIQDITDRKRVEDAIRESEMKLRGIMNATNESIWMFDPEGIILHANPTAIARFNKSEHEVVGKDFREFLPPELARTRMEQIQKVFNTGSTIEHEDRRDDTYFHHNFYPLSDDTGRVISVVSYSRDITRRKLAEEALLDSENKFRRMVKDMQVGVLLQGPHAEILVSNPKALELLGIDEDQLLGKTSFDADWNVIHEDGSPFPGPTHPVPVAIATRRSVREIVMGVYRPRTGDRIWLLVSAEPQLNDDGSVHQVICTFLEITNLKKVEKELKLLNEVLEERVQVRTSELLESNRALQQTEAKYRTVADYTYNWEYWIDPEGRYLYVSPSCLRITGYSSQEFINDNTLLYKIIHPDDLESFSNQVAAQLNSLDPFEMEFRIISKNGQIHWIGHTRRNIYEDGQYLGIRVSNHDITEKVKAEHELLNVTVEVEERERNRFSAELHDGLGPLLSTIKLYFQWLAETDNPEKIKIITEKGNNNIERAIQTTREMSHGLSSLILNNYGYVDAVLNFIQTINDTQKLNIGFTFNSNERFGIFLEMTLYRITTELISNTLKYARATHVKIEFDCDQEKNMITFTYLDNGIGFDLAGLKNTNKGLGLMNIQQRIKVIRGSMRMETSIGKGMEVTIKLPVTETIT